LPAALAAWIEGAKATAASLPGTQGGR
jgi:hypothetical protein